MVFKAIGVTEPSASVNSPLCTTPKAPKIKAIKIADHEAQ